MNKYIVFNKPYGVLCQFTSDNNAPCLDQFNLPTGVYAAGRLDKDSEGLLLLTNDGKFIDKMVNPKFHKEKTYHVQVDYIPSESELDKLRLGLIIKNYKTRPCHAKILRDYSIEPRIPPIRFRKNIPTCWLEIKLTEGKNRQVRRMTAAIGHPTLRLIRVGIGNYKMAELAPGQWLEVDKSNFF